MILVNSANVNDYAIMKQVQQIRLINPTDAALSVGSFDPALNLSKIGLKETLYVVSHGRTGDFHSGPVTKNGLLSYLSDQKFGVPQGFSGDIVLLSCYSGDALTGDKSLAAYVALMLTGRVAKNTVVTGATGYSFGTPEFRQSGRSSVLCTSDFYSLGNINKMAEAWLKLKPTHTAGVLHDELGVKVETGKTIAELLATVGASHGPPEVIAKKYVTGFADKARRIEDALKGILAGTAVPKKSIADAADFLVTRDQEPAVQEWNTNIKDQYELYGNLYLWKASSDAFKDAYVQ